VPASGPAPALLRFDELASLTPAWEKVTAAIEANAHAVKVLGEPSVCQVVEAEGVW
jgi:hypothetical protein